MPPEHERIFSMLMQEDEVTWQSIIYDLVNAGDIDPWNVDVGLLAAKFVDMLKKLQQLDFRISGKVVLAAAILLKIKSNRFMGADMADFDNLLKVPEEEMYEEQEDLNDHLDMLDQRPEKPSLIPRTPQPRERKVTIFDLMDALQHALSTKQRKILRELPDVDIKAPVKTKDITEIIREVFTIIQKKSKVSELLSFEDIAPSQSKEDKIFTFIPLLHLDNQRKVDLIQKQHFDQILVKKL